jgi:hypothetical protein
MQHHFRGKRKSLRAKRKGVGLIKRVKLAQEFEEENEFASQWTRKA